MSEPVNIEDVKATLERILAPFPATVGSSEDMLEDWMGAVSRYRAIAARALAALNGMVLVDADEAKAALADWKWARDRRGFNDDVRTNLWRAGDALAGLVRPTAAERSDNG